MVRSTDDVTIPGAHCGAPGIPGTQWRAPLTIPALRAHWCTLVSDSAQGPSTISSCNLTYVIHGVIHELCLRTSGPLLHRNYIAFGKIPRRGVGNRYAPGVWGSHGPRYKGSAAATWAPMGARVPVLAPNDHPNPSSNRQKVSEKLKFPKILEHHKTACKQQFRGF